MTARYALYPGPVTSRVDGDQHQLTARALAFCYGVPLAACLIVRPGDRDDPSRREYVRRALALIPLYPRRDGCYVLPAVPAARPAP